MREPLRAEYPTIRRRNLRGLYWPGPDGADGKPLIVSVGGFDSILEELYLVFGKAAIERGHPS